MPKRITVRLWFRAIAIVVSALAPILVISQSDPVHLTQYTEADGLPSSQIYTLETDRFGYIWIGTINGLSQFDGHEFRRFYSDPLVKGSFKGLNVWYIFEDKKGRIWISSGPSILNMYDPATRIFKQYDYLHLVIHPANFEPGISTINQDSYGNIYFGVNTNYGEPIQTGMLYYNEATDQIERIEYPSGNIFSSTADHNGNVWFLGMDGLYKMDRHNIPQKIPFPIDNLNQAQEHMVKVCGDPQGNLWLVSSRINVYKYNITTGAYSAYNLSEVTSSRYEYAYPNLTIADNKLWIGTNKGLITFNTKTGAYENLNSEVNDVLSIYGILSLNFDSFGSLWIGTFSGGLFRYDGKSLFRIYRAGGEKSAITPGWANNLYEGSDGKIWVTTSGQSNEGGINSIDLTTGKVQMFPFTTLNDSIFIILALFETPENKFHVSTNQGIYEFDPMKPKLSKKIRFPGIGDTVFIHHFHKDRKGAIWLCTFNGLYKKSTNDNSYIHYDLSHFEGSNAASNEITWLYETPQQLWILTNNGLYTLNNNTNEIRRHGYNATMENVFISQDINAFMLDANGNAWVGSWQGGLSRYDIKTGKIKNYTMNDGLPSMSVQGILEDKTNNHIWISTFEGLSRYDLKTGEFSNFSMPDGLSSQLFADASSIRTSAGLYIFGTSNGIVVIDPAQVRTNNQPPKILLTDFKLFDQSLVPGESSILPTPIFDTRQITLKHNQNTFTIEFNSIHYRNPNRNRTLCILENYDSQWREVGNQHFAFYSNIPPGKYFFRLKAANNNGIWNLNGPVLEIIITPPWWKTLWAYIGYILLALLLVLAADRYFRNRIIKIENQKAQARELEHGRQIEKAYRELQYTQAQLIQSEKMASLGELTAGIAHEIKNPLNFVNNFSELNAELVNELISEIEAGNTDMVISLAQNIRENEEKISIHGKRADSIIKGMLQHSRINGNLEITDINALAEEYLRLAWHGMKAKEKSFNTTILTDFDETAGKLRVIPQEIGRVILNLLNNAFYSVHEKKLLFGDGYEPIVTLGTHRNKSFTEIRISDNGMGIPQHNLDKIFMPFFTTKPAGQGTGLGLSMSFDIITKGHGGELRVDSQEGEGAEFKILLPQQEKR